MRIFCVVLGTLCTMATIVVLLSAVQLVCQPQLVWWAIVSHVLLATFLLVSGIALIATATPKL